MPNTPSKRVGRPKGSANKAPRKAKSPKKSASAKKSTPKRRVRRAPTVAQLRSECRKQGIAACKGQGYVNATKLRSLLGKSPRKPRSANPYIRYASNPAIRAAAVQKAGTKKASEVAKVIGAQWQALSASAKDRIVSGAPVKARKTRKPKSPKRA